MARTPGSRPWTPSDDDALARLAAAPLSLTEIAAALDRTYDAVAARIKKRGLRHRRQPPDAAETARIRALWADGTPVREIAAAVHRSQRTIAGVLGLDWASAARPGEGRYVGKGRAAAAVQRTFPRGDRGVRRESPAAAARWQGVHFG